MPGESRCSPKEIQHYIGKISGPLLDRIDIHIEVPSVKFQDMTSNEVGEASSAIRSRVLAARGLQHDRFRHKPRITCNARMGSRELKHFCALDESTLELIKNAMSHLGFSARGYDRILKVARTIADLAGTESIEPEHVQEGIQYRSLDRQIWSV